MAMRLQHLINILRVCLHGTQPENKSRQMDDRCASVRVSVEWNVSKAQLQSHYKGLKQ